MKLYDWKKLINEEQLNDVINTLNNSGIIIFPTDTVYGIACNCFDEIALKKIYSFKKRPESKPICVLINSYEKMKLVTNNINEKEKYIIEKYMPGALTIVLEKKEGISNYLTANLPTIGVRIPKGEIVLKILENYPYPLATTSVNISGEEPGLEISDFYNEFKDKVDIIIDGGKTTLQEASTIVRVVNDKVEILRYGAIEIKE